MEVEPPLPQTAPTEAICLPLLPGDVALRRNSACSAMEPAGGQTGTRIPTDRVLAGPLVIASDSARRPALRTRTKESTPPAAAKR